MFDSVCLTAEWPGKQKEAGAGALFPTDTGPRLLLICGSVSWGLRHAGACGMGRGSLEQRRLWMIGVTDTVSSQAAVICFC